MIDAGLEVFDDTPMRQLTMDDVSTGQAVFQRVRFHAAMMTAFAQVANDRAPVHEDPRFARSLGFDRPIVQGFALATRFSRLIGMYLPGAHTILESVELKFRRPVHVDEDTLYRVVVDRVFRPMRIVVLALSISVEGTTRAAGTCRCLVR